MGKREYRAELWSAAVEVARKEGINRTARELHVAWDDLKRRMPARRSSSAATGLCGVADSSGNLCSRLHDRTGRPQGKLRIHWKGATAADVATLSRALWDVAS